MTTVNLGILGLVAVGQDGKVTRPDVNNNPFNAKTAYGSFTMRESGLEQEVVKNRRIITALTDPGKYLKDKNDEIVALDTQLNAVYETELLRGVQLGYSNEKATDLAKKHMINEKERLMKEIDKDYPDNVVLVAK